MVNDIAYKFPTGRILRTAPEGVRHMPHRPKLFLVPNCGRSFGGYRSGRKRVRGTPEMDSTAITRSAGTLPRLSQLEIDPCDLSPKSLASSVCPSTALQASSSATLQSMPAINAQPVNGVNAYCGNGLREHARMGRKAEIDPSPFWSRMTDAWRAKGLPTSQNGVAEKLGMSQGSTRRWYLGDGYPEISTLIEIAEKGNVTVDWLLTARLPKHPIDENTLLGAIHASWSDLDDTGRDQVHGVAEGRLALLKQQNPATPAKIRKVK